MNILAWILFGLIIGLLAYMLDAHMTTGGAIGAVILGVTGAVVGGVTASFLLHSTILQIHANTLMVAGAGALILLMMGKVISRR